jgi:hypothetical protein
MKLSLAIAPLLLVASSLLVGCADAEDASVAVPDGELDPQASVHLKGGKRSAPTFVDSGLTLSALGSLSGLGNGDIVVNLSAVGQPHATCANPGSGAHEPAGQNPVEVTLTGTQAIPSSEIKNGSVQFSLSSGAPDQPVGAPDCPSSQWTETIHDVSFSSATIIVTQGGSTVLSLGCTFSPATSDGPVDRQAVTCQKL